MKSLRWPCIGLLLFAFATKPVGSQEKDPPPGPGGEQGEEAKPGDEGKGEEGDNPPEPEPPAPEEPATPADANRGLPESDPEFSKETSKTEFDKAKALYLEGKYKEAEPIFKKVKADAKSKDDKIIVDVWAMGSKGQVLLEKVRARVKARQLQPALQEAQTYMLQYSGTPAEAGFRQVVKEVEAQLYTVIESFDSPSGAYIEKYGKTFVKDPALELDGTSCLRWANTKDRTNVTLKVRNVPQDFTKFEAVEFWVYLTVPPTDVEAVLGCGDTAGAKKKAKPAPTGGKKKKATDEEASGHYVAQVRFPAGTKKWQKVRIPISEFQSQGDATLTNVLYFQLQLGEGRNFDLMIDKIALQKKSGAAGASAERAETKKKAK